MQPARHITLTSLVLLPLLFAVPGTVSARQSRDIAMSGSRRARRRGVVLQARETLPHAAGGGSHGEKEAI
jgi:hypothetical protein